MAPRNPFANLPAPMQPFRGILPTQIKTFQIAAPAATHFRPATCAEIECPAWANGWVTYLDESSAAGRQQAQYIRAKSERAFTERREPDGRTAMVFKPGQRCFRSGDHRVQLEREPLFIARDGDAWRRVGEPHVFGGRLAADNWVDEFAHHQDKLVTQRERAL